MRVYPTRDGFPTQRSSLGRRFLLGATFLLWLTFGIAVIWATAWALATAADEMGPGRGVFDRPGLSASAAHLRLADVTYQDVRGVASCSDTCAGHEAGWRWGRARRVGQASECGGRSRSFVEGCWAYGEEVGRLTG